jgi:hypothetical protein
MASAPYAISPNASDATLTGEAVDNDGRTCRFARPLTSRLIGAWVRQQTPHFSRQRTAPVRYSREGVALEQATIEWGDLDLSIATESPDPDQGSTPRVVRLSRLRTPATLHWISGYSDTGNDLSVELQRPDADGHAAMIDQVWWQTGVLALRRVAQMVLCPCFGRIDGRPEPLACTIVDTHRHT